MSRRKFAINEIFYSLQGEGTRAGTANVFVRFSGCNLRCNGTIEGEAYQPVCDTEFVSSRTLGRDALIAEIEAVAGTCRWVIATGGEPMQQLDDDFVAALHKAGFQIAVETNGTFAPPVGLDFICVSPKTAEHTLRVTEADEVKYVRDVGQAIPRPSIKATHRLISPAFGPGGVLWPATLQHCIQLCKDNPQWRLSVQQHKTWMVR